MRKWAAQQSREATRLKWPQTLLRLNIKFMSTISVAFASNKKHQLKQNVGIIFTLHASKQRFCCRNLKAAQGVGREG
jgi:hypothetical protein